MQSRPTAELAILLVDDERQTLKYFERAFAKDFNVLTAPSADEAEAIVDANAGKIGVVISDQRMPGRSGVSLLNSVRRKHPSIVRMLTTAYSELDDAIEAVNRGEIFRYIVKPWDFDLLRQEIKTGLLVYSLQSERELLIGEKLVARRRMVAVDRVRDLAVIAASLPKLSRAPLAVDDYVRDCATSAPPLPADAAIANQDLWSLPQAEARHMAGVAAEAARLAEKLRDGSGTAALAACVKDAIAAEAAQAAAAKVRVAASDAAALNLKVAPGVAQDIVGGVLSALIAGSPEHGEVTITTAGGVSVNGTDGAEVRLVTGPTERSADTVLYSNGGVQNAAPGKLFASYLAARECGGSVRMTRGAGGLSAVIALPLDPGKAQQPDVRPDWLQKVFQYFEEWPA